jgi:hypothetical protein
MLSREPVQRMCDFDRVQVLSLNVLNEGYLQQTFICKILDNDRNFRETGEAGGSPAPLARNNLVRLPFAANDERLDNAIGSYRLS